MVVGKKKNTNNLQLNKEINFNNNQNNFDNNENNSTNNNQLQGNDLSYLSQGEQNFSGIQMIDPNDNLNSLDNINKPLVDPKLLVEDDDSISWEQKLKNIQMERENQIDLEDKKPQQKSNENFNNTSNNDYINFESNQSKNSINTTNFNNNFNDNKFKEDNFNDNKFNDKNFNDNKFNENISIISNNINKDVKENFIDKKIENNYEFYQEIINNLKNQLNDKELEINKLKLSYDKNIKKV